VALVAAAAFAGAVVQSATGLGFALVAGPVAFAVLGPEAAVVLLAALALVVNALVLAERGPVAWPLLRPVLWAAPFGAVAGTLLLRALPASALQAALGVGVLAAVALHARRRPVRAPAAAMGVLSGALTTSIGVNGPPLALWLAARGVAPAALRTTLAAAFTALALVGLAALAPGVTETPGADVVLASAVAVVAGQRLGRRAFVRLDAARHERALLAVVSAAGVASIAAALA